MPDWFKNGFVRLLNPVVALLVRRRVHPNLISSFGFIVTLVGAILIFQRSILAGVVVFLLGGMMDILDGRVARETGLASSSAPSTTRPAIGCRRSSSTFLSTPICPLAEFCWCSTVHLAMAAR